MTNYNRRTFLKNAGIVSVGFMSLSKFVGCTPDTTPNASMPTSSPYGELVKDPNGLIDLPQGFSYKIISKGGDLMDDGFRVPGLADGMATFVGKNNRVIIVRNHENSREPVENGAFGENMELLTNIPAEKLYDFGNGETPGLGGTTTIVYNEETQQIERQYLSLAGTYRNCAGGPTPWGSWISCEEDVTTTKDGATVDHGFNFEVPATENINLIDPIPIKDMGRFNHEAVCIDPRTGIVYQTEDAHDGLIYRYLPIKKGDLHAGGTLQILAIKAQKSFDTRNWEEQTINVGESLEVEWLDIDNILAPDNDLRLRGFANGAARFARGEGMWFGDGELYFACTNGGKMKFGQVFKYVPSPYEGTAQEKDQTGQLTLFAESNDRDILKSCDNLTIAPWGDVILCEDDKDPYIRGVNADGEIYTLGHNVGAPTEFAGAVFSPSGKTLFVNIQGIHHTLAITGPWKQETFG